MTTYNLIETENIYDIVEALDLDAAVEWMLADLNADDLRDWDRADGTTIRVANAADPGDSCEVNVGIIVDDIGVEGVDEVTTEEHA
jgi:hypothetical protein